MVFVRTKNLSLSGMLLTILIGLGMTAVWTSAAQAGNWRVMPIKIFFDTRTRSEVITVTNAGDQPLALEVTAMEWTQDPQGRDIYKPAADLIFFPKQLTVGPKKERVIRTGIKVPAINREKTYRLFIKEVPDRSQSAPNAVAIAIQFGVPIFVKPVKEEIQGEILNPQVAGGQLRLSVANTGNSHFRIGTVGATGVDAAGESIYSEEVRGGYLLPGSVNEFSIPIEPEVCNHLKAIDIRMDSEQLHLEKKLDINPAQCGVQ